MRAEGRGAGRKVRGDRTAARKSADAAATLLTYDTGRAPPEWLQRAWAGDKAGLPMKPPQAKREGT